MKTLLKRILGNLLRERINFLRFALFQDIEIEHNYL